MNGFGLSATDVYLYTVIGCLTLVSVLTRAGFLLFGDYIPLPDGVRRALRYAPAAALTAIIVPDLLPWHADTGPQFDLRLVAGVAATLVFLRTRSAVAVIVTGMVVLWGLRAALG
jgi:branched-subunit amino acid transport protein